MIGTVLHISPHPALHYVFETLAYTVGFAIYRRLRLRSIDPVNEQQRWQIIAAAGIGAVIGSRLLQLLEQAPAGHVPWGSIVSASGGKTIVGGLLGGWIAVEIFKKFAGIRSRTGDLLALPLCFGIAIGRIGCFLAGTADDTYGTPTSLPWATDFGDGVPRHPTQAYEILFLMLVGTVLKRAYAAPHAEGMLFRLFMALYLGWRLLSDFLKPEPRIYGLSAIQWACLMGCLFSVGTLQERWNAGPTTEN